jgi:hypothetical protein
MGEAFSADRLNVFASETVLPELIIQGQLIGDAIDEEDPLQVIHLMLDATGEQAIRSFKSYFTTIFCCHLGCVWSILFRTSKTHFTS